MVTLVNRAKMTTATTGTGTLTLGSAVGGYQSFAAAGVADGNTVRYVIEDGNNWEIGTGVYTASGTTLSRTVSESTAAGSAINLTGNAVVYVSATAESFDILDITSLGTSQPSKVITADSGGKIFLNGATRSNVVAVSALDIDCSSGNYFTKTISGNSTFTFSNAPSSSAYSFAFELTHTSGTVTWPASVKWPGDSAPSLTTGKTHLFVFVTDDAGTRWRGAAITNYTN